MDSVAIQTMHDLIEEDLVLAFDHLQDGLEDLALHQLENARQKICQIKELKQPAASSCSMKRISDAETTTTSENDSGNTAATHPQGNR